MNFRPTDEKNQSFIIILELAILQLESVMLEQHTKIKYHYEIGEKTYHLSLKGQNS